MAELYWGYHCRTVWGVSLQDCIGGIIAELSKNKQANNAKIFPETTPCFFGRQEPGFREKNCLHFQSIRQYFVMKRVR
jgi:hypothetical protein